jgi:hypothetical protein
MIIKMESQFIKVLLQEEKLSEIIEIGLLDLPSAVSREQVAKQVQNLLKTSREHCPDQTNKLLSVIFKTLAKILPQGIKSRGVCKEYFRFFKQLLYETGEEAFAEIDAEVNFSELASQILNHISTLPVFEKSRNQLDWVLQGLLQIEYAILNKFPKQLRDPKFKARLVSEVGGACLFKISAIDESQGNFIGF